MSKATVVLAAFVAAVFFFVCAVFSIDLGSVPLVEAGLLSGFAGFLLERVP